MTTASFSQISGFAPQYGLNFGASKKQRKKKAQQRRHQQNRAEKQQRRAARNLTSQPKPPAELTIPPDTDTINNELLKKKDVIRDEYFSAQELAEQKEAQRIKSERDNAIRSLEALRNQSYKYGLNGRDLIDTLFSCMVANEEKYQKSIEREKNAFVRFVKKHWHPEGFVKPRKEIKITKLFDLVIPKSLKAQKLSNDDRQAIFAELLFMLNDLQRCVVLGSSMLDIYRPGMSFIRELTLKDLKSAKPTVKLDDKTFELMMEYWKK